MNKSLKRSKSFNDFTRHDNKCMSTICTCHRPHHRCPHNYNRGYFDGKTVYRNEFTPKKVEKATVYKARDNLQSKPGIFGGTLYNRDYFKPYKNESFRKNLELQGKVKKAIKDTNTTDKVKGLLKGPRNSFERKSVNREDVVVVRQGKWRRPSYSPIRNKTTELKSTYRNDFKQRKVEAKTYKRLNYDNIRSYNPDNKFLGDTNYRVNHNRKSPERNSSRSLYKMNKDKNNHTTGIFFDKRSLQTTNQVFYKGQQNKPRGCDLMRMPEVPRQLLGKNTHVVYDAQVRTWKHQ